MKYVIEVLCLVYYITSAIESVPSIVRVIMRRSSSDYSLASTYLSFIGTISWSAYIYLTEQTELVYIGTAFDMILSLVYTYVITKYHKNK